MFGFVRIDKNEMKIKDFDAYKAVYCSLCKCLSKEYGPFAGFLLNYDLTFLVVFSIAVSDKPPCFTKGRCRYNPLKSCKYCKASDDVMSKSAALLVLMTYYKLLDNINDSCWFKAFLCKMLRPFVGMWRNKAKKKYPDYDSMFSNYLRKQLECESLGADVDLSAEPTALLLKDVFASLADGEKSLPAFEQFGYHLGKWIYLMDAANDIDDDIKNKSFNPIYNKLHLSKTESAKYCDEILSQSVYLLTCAYNLIDIKNMKSVLDNIILLGLTKKQKEVLYSRKEK